MATMITSECINCGACEPECPNTAIYQGGVEWQAPDGAKRTALSDDIFYIVPEKCTECVGFFDHEACAAVCPVDACVPNPEIPETEAVLLARARALHPDKTIPDDAPSRFRKGDGEGAAAAPAAAPAAPAAAPVKTAAAPAPAPARAAAKPGSGKVEKAAAPPKPRPQRSFKGELPVGYDELLSDLGAPRRTRSGGGLLLGLVAALQGVLGALPDGEKRHLEEAVSDGRYFSAQLATAVNLFLNLLLYPLVVLGAALARGANLFSPDVHGPLFWGTIFAVAEGLWRLRENVFRFMPLDQAPLRGAIYGILLWPLGRILLALVGPRGTESGVGFDGFYGNRESFDDKTERARRYGEVYRLEDRDDAYLFRLELPRTVPPSSLGAQLDLPTEMPDYDYDIQVVGGDLVVHGKVADAQVHKLTAVAPAFPPTFTTRVRLADDVVGFRHRYRDKVLEVILPKAAAH
ncbi:MAG: 4Fe-4S dicluster domain-containing protein [Candidatus Binatia bacterium]